MEFQSPTCKLPCDRVLAFGGAYRRTMCTYGRPTAFYERHTHTLIDAKHQYHTSIATIISTVRIATRAISTVHESAASWKAHQ
eukprot:4164220-Pleurochrysis_carterae.AAC.1